ncbi:glycosyltransferase [Saccharopolyspora sp. 5N102]|uniref:glycosyltransferase n=1 Tax=Saccharopolyspora sp. 5N102 TaxID=3375155 RepID=UPI00378FAFC0
MIEFPHGGWAEDAFAGVARAFRENFAIGAEVGAGVCVYHRGEVAVRPRLGRRPDAVDGVPWLPMRYVPFNGGALLPSWAMRRPQRPRICLTLGTVAPLLPGGGGLGTLIEALAELDADIVLADAETDLSQFEPLPENVHPAGFVPLSGILRDCSLIVHHGGPGTTASALHYGVPQLIVPGGADNELCAQRVVDRKVGLAADPSTLDDSVIRELAERLLAEESFSQEAAEVRAEMAAQPSPAAIIDRIAAEIAG